MPELTRYQGSCHCGAVRYQVSMELGQVIACNCSICSRTGTLLAFVPAAQFELLAGDDALTDYQFNKHVIHHLFCRTCGVRSFARGVGPDGAPMVAVNARCLEGVDPDSLAIVKYDGRSA